MDEIFSLCVQILLFPADVFGTTYVAVNVWIFVIIWPLFTLGLIVTVFLQYRKIRKLKGESSSKG